MKIKVRTKSIFAILVVIMIFASFLQVVNAGVAPNLLETKELSETNIPSLSKFFDLRMFQKEYFSNNDESNLSLPFFKIFTEDVTYNSKIINSGLTFTSKNIIVKDSLTSNQFLIAEDTVIIEGDVENVFVIAQNIIIRGKVSGDFVAFAGSIFITETAEITKDAIFYTDKAEVRGNIDGNLIANAYDLYVSGNIKQDFRVNSEVLKLENETIEGNLFLKTNMDISEIKLKYPSLEHQEIVKEQEEETINTIDVKSFITKMLWISLLYSLMYLIFFNKPNNKINKLQKNFISKPFYTILIGLAVYCTIPLIVFILILSSIFWMYPITIPLFIVYFATIITIILLKQFIFASVMTNMITSSKADKNYKKIIIFLIAMAVNMIVYTILNIGILTGLISQVFVILAFGVVFGKFLLKDKKIIKESIKEDI